MNPQECWKMDFEKKHFEESANLCIISWRIADFERSFEWMGSRWWSFIPPWLYCRLSTNSSNSRFHQGPSGCTLCTLTSILVPSVSFLRKSITTLSTWPLCIDSLLRTIRDPSRLADSTDNSACGSYLNLRGHCAIVYLNRRQK